MPVLQASQIADLIVSAQNDLGRYKWTDLSYDLQRYTAVPQLFTKRKVTFSSGPAIQWNVFIGTSGAAHDTGLFAVDDVNISDVLHTASIPWRHWNTNYAIERREIAMNGSPSKIVDLVKTRRHDAVVDMVKHGERRFWGAPTSSSDTERIYGVDYWNCWTDNSATNADGGFDGGNPSGFSDTAGLSASTYAEWNNWCAKYTTVSSSDLVKKLRKAATFTEFKAPVPSATYSMGMQLGLYTNYDVINALETIAEQQNDNLGNDIASKDGKVLFRGMPVEWVPYLEDRTGDPVYGLQWADFQPVCLSGEWMRETGPTPASNQHTVFTTHIDCSLNIQCRNRRTQFVIAKSDPTAVA